LTRETVEIGEVVEGRYKILKRLAEGGMGTVFLAEHWLIKRKVALKVLHGELLSDGVMVNRFMNEAHAAGTLGHPNIVEATDMGFTRQDVPFIVFEYLEGTVLVNEVYRLGCLPARRALKIAHQIASALEAAHNANIVHRDLKSDNIFLTDRGDAVDHVKVLDFGISRFLETKDRKTGRGMLMGTPEFMAPEQITHPDAIDGRADIYALGVVLYEMLTGRVPFALPAADPARKTPDIDAAHALMHRILQEAPPSFSSPDGPPGLPEMIAEKLLAKDPAKRFQKMKDVQAAIEAFAGVMQRAGTSPIAEVDSKPPPKAPEIEAIADQTVSRSALSPDEMAREVKQLGKRWSLDGHDLRLDLYSRSMAKLATVVDQIAAIADEMDHHPKIAIEFPRLIVRIEKAMTTVDLIFAARIEQWLIEKRWI
jgi:serine/threonine protein kinase